MLQFSWHSHLVQVGEYRRWVDAGAPPPTHKELAHYLSWVLARATHGVELRLATVARVELDPAGWRLTCESAGDARAVATAERGLVLTGPGAPNMLPHAAELAGRILAPAMPRSELEAVYLTPASRVCIIGNGESAISMALWLIRRHGEDLDLTFVAPSLPYSRAESFLENSVYSDPQLVAWRHLAEAERHQFVRRTDRGVMSPAALAQLARHRKLSFVVGRVTAIELSRSGRAKVVVDQPDEIVRQEFDAVAICTGSSPLAGLIRLLGDSRAPVEARLGCSLGDEPAVIRQLDVGLALRGLSPRLHIPALGGLVHGPGLANLSCLGSLSDCILSCYAPAPQLFNGKATNSPSLVPAAGVQVAP
jgi:mycobactin lysine-N-oxygenase